MQEIKQLQFNFANILEGGNAFRTFIRPKGASVYKPNSCRITRKLHKSPLTLKLLTHGGPGSILNCKYVYLA